ncbi:hypothetical protein [Adlercreutzia agrestimuris]|uniref:hypothetical protein n=1 Tax=Adlercreutzia agrestimuris TaxID=2941324 RepID=UPI00203F7DB6|nr:hypothetical protein [Adlercreutzia agrestimuris]
MARELGVVDVEQVPAWYFEQVVDKTFSGLQMFARDVNLPSQVVQQYQPGTILCEPTVVDTTSRYGGLARSHRIAILSNHLADVSEMFDSDSEAAAWGLCVAQARSHFKVLDVYEVGTKTQILLLHLPDDENWRLFDHVVLSVEEDFIEDCRQRFTAKCDLEPIAELNTETWYDRVSDPVGFSDTFSPWPLEVSLEDRMQPLGQLDFRKIQGSVLYVRDVASLLHLEAKAAGFPDAIVYGYIDEEAGLSMQVLCAASLSENRITISDVYDDLLLILRSGSVKEHMGAQLVNAALSDFSNRISDIHGIYERNQEVEKTRNLRFLDNLRNADYPDDIQAILLSDAQLEGFEMVWMRLVRIEGDSIIARLLNEPAQSAYGVHVGQLLPLVFRESEEGVFAFALADQPIQE